MHLRHLSSRTLTGLLGFALLLSFSPTHRAASAQEPGGKIVYGTSKALFSVNPDGSGKRRLFYDSGAAPNPFQVSPDGSKVGFLQYAQVDTHWTLRTVSLSTGRVKKLVPAPVWPFWNDYPSIGAWSNSSSRIAVSRSSQGLWVVNADGNNLKRLRKKPASRMSWNKDDSKLVFIRLGGKGRNKGIVYYDFRKKKTKELAGGYAPRWSPVQNLVALVTKTGRRVKVINTRGDIVLQSPRYENVIEAAEWTPDGAGLILVQGSNLMYMPLDGTKIQTMLTLPGKQSTSISPLIFSPNGKKLAFGTCSTNRGCGNPASHSIYTAGPHGEDPVEQINEPPGATLSLLAWSPNSKALLVCKRDKLKYFFETKLARVKGVPTCNAQWTRRT